jgi:hypothetical protein
MNHEEVKKVYLAAVGNPESGVFADFADDVSEAIVKAFSPKEEKTEEPAKEIRVVKVEETR